MYIARHYVRVNGKMFTPGEVITEAIPNDKAIRLAALNAIDKVADISPSENEAELADGLKQESNEPDYSAPVASALPEPEADDTDDAEDEEEAEAPEIDVTDGIVSEPEPEEAPATPRKRSKKK